MKRYLIAILLAALHLMFYFGQGAYAQSNNIESSSGRPIRLIVPVSPGPSYDFAARQTGAKLSHALSQAVPIINMPGAGGSVAIMSMLSAPANGETAVFGTHGSVVIAPLLNAGLGYKHDNLVPIEAMLSDASVIFTASTSQMNSLADLKKKSSQGQSVKIGHVGVGSAGHLLILKLEATWKTRFINVPYKLTSNAYRDLITGELDAFVSSTGASAAAINSQGFQGLAISDIHRHACLPQVRTFSEQGVDIVMTGWAGLFVSSATPEATVQHLRNELRKIQVDPELKEALKKACLTPSELTPREFAKTIDRDVAHWREEIRRSGLDKGVD